MLVQEMLILLQDLGTKSSAKIFMLHIAIVHVYIHTYLCYLLVFVCDSETSCEP